MLKARSSRALFGALVAALPVALVAAGLVPPVADAAPLDGTRVDGGRYGSARIATPPSGVRGYVVYFSDRGGWSRADDAALAALASAGALSVGVDLDAYLARIAATTARCDQLVGDAEGLSRQLQRRDGGGQYFFPILAGSGAGGMLAAATLAQAPVNTLAGAVSIDPQPWLPGARPLCAGLPSTADGPGFRYGLPATTLNGFWIVARTGIAGPATREYVDDLARHAAPGTADLRDAGLADAAGIGALVAPHLAPAIRAGVGDVRGLPLIELPVAGRPSPDRSATAATDKPATDLPATDLPAMAILLSGDGGWRDLDKTIAENLQRDGIPVVGWDCVRYFWTPKTPEQTAADLGAVIDAYAARWHAARVALVGYSFGANVLPFAYALLPPARQQRVVQLSLLALESRTDWEIQVSGWLGAAPSAAAMPVAPALERVPAAKIQCFYGEGEKDTMCPALAAAGAEVIRTRGNHHFDGDYPALARRIADGMRRRTGAAAADAAESALRSGAGR